MKTRTLICCASKRGLKKDDFEDAFTSPQQINWSADKVRLAIADGATESSFSKEWASMMVARHLNPGLDVLDAAERQALARQLEIMVAGRELPWFATEKAEMGACATLLSVTIDSHDGTWAAQAVGDSCLFVIREERLETSFPLGSHTQFNSSPELICSKESNNGRISEWLKKTSGRLVAGDLLIVATDALSAWFLEAHANGGKPWRFFDELSDDGQRKKQKMVFSDDWKTLERSWSKHNGGEVESDDYFQKMIFGPLSASREAKQWRSLNKIFLEWLNKKRDDGRIKNDDSTLLVVKILKI